MLCSIPTTSTGKSGPTNWLDRLRSNKGFLTDNLPVDHLTTTSESSSTTTATHSNSKRVTTSEPPSVSVSMSNILSDLFNMAGDNGQTTPRLSGKKGSSRKQTNPKYFCLGENNDNNCSKTTSSSDNQSNNNHNLNNCDDDDEIEEEEEEEDREMKGYRRSEVTVIDTSGEIWKVDKLVFRKKNVWKVRDKKGKSSCFRSSKINKKKRKGIEFDFPSAKKKPKLLSNDHKSLDEKRKDDSTGTPDTLSQVPKKRYHFFRSPRKLEKGGSSAVLIKAIPTSKKSTRTPPKNNLKDT